MRIGLGLEIVGEGGGIGWLLGFVEIPTF